VKNDLSSSVGENVDSNKSNNFPEVQIVRSLVFQKAIVRVISTVLSD